MEWQPIETAPIDGSEVLVFGGTFVHDQQTYFDAQPANYVTIASYEREGTAKHHWRGQNCGGHDEYYWHRPTHWIPIPASPLSP